MREGPALAHEDMRTGQGLQHGNSHMKDYLKVLPVEFWLLVTAWILSLPG